MTRDDIIRIAREAGFDDFFTKDLALERFANLVAAAEREACAKACERLIPHEYAANKVNRDDRGFTELCAALIRMRGET